MRSLASALARRRRPTGTHAWLVGIIITAGVTLGAVTTAEATGSSSARAVAMGGAHIGLASGIDAARFNPANLGLSSHRSAGLELVGLGANIANNSFSLSDYNKYSGAFLTAQDKQDLLGKIPNDGLRLAADLEASAFALSVGQFALAITGVGVADINLSRDLFELALNGNTYADTIRVDGSSADAVSYVSAGVSYGHAIYTNGSRQLAVGATLKYLRGIAVERVVELTGMAATYATGFWGEGKLTAQTATGGAGYAADVGVALRFNQHYTVGARLENFISNINWTSDPEEHGFLFSFDTMTVDNMNEDYVVAEDYSRSIDAFSTNLPTVLTLGVANTSGKLVWALDYQQKFRSANGHSTKPRVALGAEWRFMSVLPLRAGYATGGDRNTVISFGSGVRLWAMYLDVAAVTGSTISGYSAKGLNLAVSTGLQF